MDLAGVPAPVGRDGATAYLKGMLLEEAQGMGKHLQGRHFFAIYGL